MPSDEDMEERTGESGLTTRDLAHPQSGGQAESAAVFPGEATADMPGDTRSGDEESAAASGPDRPLSATDEDEPLLDAAEAERYRTKWNEVQGQFVDDPQDAVRSADGLVAEVMQDLARTFATHKEDLEGQWGKGEQVATEDLRLALQRYRSFFNRLLRT
ncbi:hypothetical protein [Streptomyces sp. NBC_01565]|uniref:hypothetical protein n=1 Tax=unclassified Streptomyces TaxID=2593676 RepID=UPI00224DC4CC|nr:hypothetical protein [Streptomyces sp. NBC_01565]MCX4545452.1 hypothetical protein [Streptomyces sp. NBC_01565]